MPKPRPLNTNVSTEGWMPISRPVPAVAPPLELQPARSPFLIGSLPTTSAANPDSIRNFTMPGIPSYRITPPPPITQSSGATNAIATVSKVARLVQPTPVPTIASPLVSIPTGFQFSFNQVRLPLSSTLAISSYKVYRNTAGNSASASVIQAIPHHPAGVGVPVVVQDSQPNGFNNGFALVTMFYWVSAVSVSGQESGLVPAQTVGVTSNAIANANSQIASSFNNQPINTTFGLLASTVLSNTGSSTAITIASTQLQFGSQPTVNYNSATVDPGTYGTSYITGLDPHFSGGSILFLVGNDTFFQTAVNAALNFGKIITASASITSGGGTTGGTTAAASPSSGGAGGRGITF